MHVFLLLTLSPRLRKTMLLLCIINSGGAGSGLMPGPTKKVILKDLKIHLKAKKKELSAWALNHRPQAYISMFSQEVFLVK